MSDSVWQIGDCEHGRSRDECDDCFTKAIDLIFGSDRINRAICIMLRRRWGVIPRNADMWAAVDDGGKLINEDDYEPSPITAILEAARVHDMEKLK